MGILITVTHKGGQLWDTRETCQGPYQDCSQMACSSETRMAQSTEEGILTPRQFPDLTFSLMVSEHTSLIPEGTVAWYHLGTKNTGFLFLFFLYSFVSRIVSFHLPSKQQISSLSNLMMLLQDLKQLTHIIIPKMPGSNYDYASFEGIWRKVD